VSVGEQLRDSGISAVLEAQSAEWRSLYRALAAQFMARQPTGSTFIGEAMRLFAIENGLHEPLHPNAWGAMARTVLNEWIEERAIIRSGWSKSTAKRAHARAYPLYIVL